MAERTQIAQDEDTAASAAVAGGSLHKRDELLAAVHAADSPADIDGRTAYKAEEPEPFGKRCAHGKQDAAQNGGGMSWDQDFRALGDPWSEEAGQATLDYDEECVPGVSLGRCVTFDKLLGEHLAEL